MKKIPFKAATNFGFSGDVRLLMTSLRFKYETTTTTTPSASLRWFDRHVPQDGDPGADPCGLGTPRGSWEELEVCESTPPDEDATSV